MDFKFNNDYFSIISGSSFKLNQAYMEAEESIDKSTPKGLSQLKAFISAIEEISNKEGVKDPRISASKGDIKKFKGHENIKTAMAFIKKNLSGIEILKDINLIYQSLLTNRDQYEEGYQKNINLIKLEYESAVYMIVTGLAMVMAVNMDVVQDGVSIKIQKKSGTSYGATGETIKNLAKQMGSNHHKDYLEAMIKAYDMNKSGNTKVEEVKKVETPDKDKKEENKDDNKEEKKEEVVKESVYFYEAGGAAGALLLFDTMLNNVQALGRFAKRTFIGIKNSAFGILPLIRSVMYLRYKKKADTVLALDQQCVFIQQNIEQLEQRTNMDPKKKEAIIQRQKAVIEQYQKKAAKLRAELLENERDSTTESKKDEPKISKQADDDFVLEYAGISFYGGD